MKKNKYHTHVEPYLSIIKGWSRQGANLEEIAKKLKINRKSLYKYRNQYPELEECLKTGLEEMIIFTENALYNKIREGDIKGITFFLQKKGGYIDEYAQQNLEIKKRELRLREMEIEEIKRQNDLLENEIKEKEEISRLTDEELDELLRDAE